MLQIHLCGAGSSVSGLDFGAEAERVTQSRTWLATVAEGESGESCVGP